MVLFTFSFIALFSMLYTMGDSCPLSENIAPLCICKDLGNGPMMLCSNIMSADELIPLIAATEKYDMFSLAIFNSSLLYMPKNLFQKTNFKKIRLVGTQLMSLAEEDLAFEGLEDTLEEFRVMDAHYITQWSWDHLRNLHRLEMIDVDWVSLGSISEPLPQLKLLSVFAVSRADISFIVENAFEGLENVELVVLKSNEISELSRSMFPDPANRLRLLDLSENKLRSLPEDMFDNMPSLADVDLENNEFLTLNEATFRQVLERVQFFSLKGNEIRCDCRLEWLVNTRKPLQFLGECSQPKTLKERSLKSLTVKELKC